MSIVIAVLEENTKISLFADRRIVYETTNEENNFPKSGEIIKVYKLTDTISCGMTGDARWGIQVTQKLLNNNDQLPSELIQIVKEFNIQPAIHSTFILVGQYDDGDLFLYGFKTEGGEEFIKNQSCCMIATSPIEFTQACVDFYYDTREMGHQVEYSCKETIMFAASKNPKYISEEFDFMQILSTGNSNK